jgi:uncharacterized protein YndB with AHSA1/START domain
VHVEGVDYLHLWKVKEVVPRRKLVYEWRYGGIPGSSMVTWELAGGAPGRKADAHARRYRELSSGQSRLQTRGRPGRMGLLHPAESEEVPGRRVARVPMSSRL